MINEHLALKAIFDKEISQGELPTSISDMMNYITKSEDTYFAFHSICAFLFHNYTEGFLVLIGANLVEINREELLNIPRNKMN